MDTTTSRQAASTRGFSTCDPERQGVFAGMVARAAPRTALQALRAAAPRAQGGELRKPIFVRSGPVR